MTANTPTDLSPSDDSPEIRNYIRTCWAISGASMLLTGGGLVIAIERGLFEGLSTSGPRLLGAFAAGIAGVCGIVLPTILAEHARRPGGVTNEQGSDGASLHYVFRALLGHRSCG